MSEDWEEGSGEIKVGELAVAYRRLVLWFGVQLVLSFGQALLVAVPDDGVRALLNLGCLAVLVVNLVALAYFGFGTAKALGSSVGWLWALAMFIPCINVITLLTLSFMATRACRKNGISVGFFGPKISSDGSFEQDPESLEVHEPEWRKIKPAD